VISSFRAFVFLFHAFDERTPLSCDPDSACLAVPAPAQPVVRKVEPPHWFSGMRGSQVEVLLTGEKLTGLKVDSQNPSLSVSRVTPSKNGHFAFVQIEVAERISPGKYRIPFSNSAGKTQLEFAIKARLPAAGRYQGFGPEDIIYLVMSDRFARGKKQRAAETIDRSAPRGRMAAICKALSSICLISKSLA
jgi:hypothetical protein